MSLIWLLMLLKDHGLKCAAWTFAQWLPERATLFCICPFGYCRDWTGIAGTSIFERTAVGQTVFCSDSKIESRTTTPVIVVRIVRVVPVTVSRTKVCSMLDLKAHFRAHRYLSETIKLLPGPPDEHLISRIWRRLARFSAIHADQSDQSAA